MAKGDRPWKVAVIGGGPAGIYASDILLKQLSQKAEQLGISAEAHIDIFEKNPAPYGLVRYGVAPDHPAIKLISKALDKALSNEKITLFCNVCYGRDISLEDLLEHYDALIFATGAGRDRQWNLGRGVEGVCGAGRVAGWYNAFPQISAPPLSTRAAAVVGGG
ncbi:MAG: glutamate synthase, partial [Aeriscardovia sp.]|nr:glutamate synthase [Aeriscardovia sp.]